MARCLSTHLITSRIAPLMEASYLSIIDFNIWVDLPLNLATPLSNLLDFFSRLTFHFSAFLVSCFQKLWVASLFFSFIFPLSDLLLDVEKWGYWVCVQSTLSSLFRYLICLFIPRYAYVGRGP